MTAAELKEYFLIGYDSATSLSAPGWSDDEISSFLTIAQKKLFEKYYELFETDEKARKVLNYLVISIDIPRATGVIYPHYVTGSAYPNGEYWQLPDRFAYSLKEEATLNINSCEELSLVPADWLRVYTKPINLDYYSQNVKNPFKKPYSGLVWRADVSNLEGPKLHMLITGGSYRVQTYHLTFLAYPLDISITGNETAELDNVVHQDIVDAAVMLAVKSIAITNQIK